SEALRQSLQDEADNNPLSERRTRLYNKEPYRRKITHIVQKIERQLDLIEEESDKTTILRKAKAYTVDDFKNDIQLLIESLSENGMNQIAHFGKLDDLRIRAETFGFHMAALDIRQHSGLHEQTITEMMALANDTDDYSDL